MRRLLRFILWTLAVLLALTGTLAGLAGYFLYTPDPERPRLSGTLGADSIVIDGETRTYKTYVPRDLPNGAPLILAMHGAGESAADMRIETGYAFERLADREGFALAYPNGWQGYWNTCGIDDDEASRRGIDDVKFLTAIADKFIAERGVDPGRVFAAGLSDGGHMAIRLALEAPSRFRAVAPVAANVPAPDNFKCKPAPRGGTSVLLIHGTSDRLVPYEGGQGSLLFGLFRSGNLLSTRQSAQYFADLDGISAPARAEADRISWSDGGSTEIDLLALPGAGHVFPQPYYRARRILGESRTSPDAAETIWTFFAGQKPR